VIMAEGTLIAPEDLELVTAKREVGENLDLKEAREKIEKEVLQKALSLHQGNLSRAAAELGVSRPTLYEKSARKRAFKL
jgi:two-component system, NtrC family, response regulator